MQIGFFGAAQTVTGSKHLLTLDSGKKILLDCGLFQGLGAETLPNNLQFGFEAKSISYVILSHAHIDHTGLLPKLYAEGFRGKIYCTPATQELCAALLQDSARIQQADIKFVNKKKAAQGKPLISALYTVEDAVKTIELLTTIEYRTPTKIDENITLTYTDAGHILGSASVNLIITENDTTTHLTFSGDVGRYTDAILQKPEVFPQADVIIIESTYGNSLHQEHYETETVLAQQIQHTCVEKKGSLVIPAFSVGRTQELVFALNNLYNDGKIPADVPIYVDSPLSITVTEIMQKYPRYFNSQAQQEMQNDIDVFEFPTLHFIEKKEESMALNTSQTPCVIISASGMAEAGRIKHHIANKVGHEKNTILFSGYCSPHGLGGKLIAGDDKVKIFTEWFEVKAEIVKMRSMSAHGDYEDLLQYLTCQKVSAVKKVFIVHGEYEVQQDFAQKLKTAGFSNVIIPKKGETFTI